jgi:RNA polymerase sigma-70 factor (ECF subfamily)
LLFDRNLRFPEGLDLHSPLFRPYQTSGDAGGFQRDPDVRLMLRAKKGDDGAFTQLVTTYQDRLVGVLTHLVSDRQGAEDLAQEVFLKIYKSRHGYEPTAKFSTYLFRIANNLASNRRRDRGRKREVNLPGSESGPLGAPPAEQVLAESSSLMPTRRFDRTEIQSVVQDALESLNDNQRMAVLLNKFEEMSYIDIAATLDLSVAAVKSLLSRARENLRVKLEPYVTQGHWTPQG